MPALTAWAGALKPADADDLTLIGPQGEILHPGEDGEMLHLQQRLLALGMGMVVGGRVALFRPLAGHIVHDVIQGKVGHLALGDRLSAAHDGSGIADLEHLVHPVGDVDHGDALCLQLAHDGEKYFDFIVMECSRRYGIAQAGN